MPTFAKVIVWAFTVIFPGVILSGMIYDVFRFKRQRGITVKLDKPYLVLGETFTATVSMNSRISIPANQEYLGKVTLNYRNASIAQSTEKYSSSVWQQTCNITTDILKEEDNGHSFVLSCELPSQADIIQDDDDKDFKQTQLNKWFLDISLVHTQKRVQVSILLPIFLKCNGY